MTVIDLNEYAGGPNLIPTTPHPITREKIPLTLGHEFSGVIEEVGDDITDIQLGQRVSVQPIIYDGTCGACRDGLINCCDNNGFVGLSALIEPLAVAWHSVKISPLKKGDKVLVLGGGPIGLAVIQCLKAKGAETIIASEVSPRRKDFAKEFGAHHVLDPAEDDIVARVREICGGVGADVAFDAAGAQAALDQALKAIRAQGTLVNIAVWEKPAQLQMNDLVFRERKYIGVTTYVAGDFKEVLDAIASGTLQPEPMITGVIGMDEVEEKGFRALIEEKDKNVKILVKVDFCDLAFCEAEAACKFSVFVDS
ncbi:MAG: hypothetical protein Q9196_006621 [Gyalolechia fulgens]